MFSSPRGRTQRCWMPCAVTYLNELARRAGMGASEAARRRSICMKTFNHSVTFPLRKSSTVAE